jgi:hypothetical protein
LNVPVFIGRRTCANLLGCWIEHVEREIGKADCWLRIGARDDYGWLAKRIDHVVPFNLGEPEITLWSLPEAARRIAVTLRVAERVLKNRPAAFLDRGLKGKFPLFADSQIKEVIRQIANRMIQVQRRSLRGPRFGVYQSDARHVLVDELRAEDLRINAKRKAEEFWAHLL